jgi:hypothetical protein
MAGAPAGLTLSQNRDFAGRERRPWSRRVLLFALAVVIGAGLLNVFGQRSSSESVTAPEAELRIDAPKQLRGGLFYQSRFTIDARQELRDARLVLGRGWIDGITINTVEPAPIGEASRNGDLLLDLGHVPAGDRYVLWVQGQVNPTTFTRREAVTELYDGDRRLLVNARDLTIFP